MKQKEKGNKRPPADVAGKIENRMLKEARGLIPVGVIRPEADSKDSPSINIDAAQNDDGDPKPGSHAKPRGTLQAMFATQKRTRAESTPAHAPTTEAISTNSAVSLESMSAHS